MLKIIVVTKSRNGKFGAAVVGFGIQYFRVNAFTARRDAQRMAENLKAAGHTVEIRDFTKEGL